MIVVWATNSKTVLDLRTQPDLDSELWIAPNRSCFHEAASEAEAAVVGVSRRHRPPDWLVYWRGRNPAYPLVLVVEKAREAQQHRQTLMPDHVLRTDVSQPALVAAVEQARWLSLLNGWGRELNERTDLPPRLKRALLRALRSHVVPSVSRIVRRAGCNASTVHRWWRREVGTHGPTLKRFLDGVLVVRALIYRQEEKTWGGVAQRLGVDDRTLRSATRRILDRPPSELDILTPGELDTELRAACASFLDEDPAH